MVWNNISDGDPGLASTAMQNWRHAGRFAADMVPMDTNGLTLTTGLLNLGTTSAPWANAYIATSGAVYVGGVPLTRGGGGGVQTYELKSHIEKMGTTYPLSNAQSINESFIDSSAILLTLGQTHSLSDTSIYMDRDASTISAVNTTTGWSTTTGTVAANVTAGQSVNGSSVKFSATVTNTTYTINNSVTAFSLLDRNLKVFKGNVWPFILIVMISNGLTWLTKNRVVNSITGFGYSHSASNTSTTSCRSAAATSSKFMLCGSSRYLASKVASTDLAVTAEFSTIQNTRIGEDQKATIEVLSYQTILNKYDIVDLSLTGAQTINQIITAIMNQTKITKYIPYVAPDVDVNATITDTSLITGTYWEVLKSLAYKSNSVPLVYGSSFQMVSRSLVGSVVWAFLGKGNSPSDIFKIDSYDDEGADRVRVFWIVENSAVTAKSVDATLLAKYLDEPQSINLDDVAAADRQDVVDVLLAEWEYPKPVIEFTTRFLVNQVKPLDIITISIKGQTLPLNTFIWGSWKWGDGSVWGRSAGSILIDSATEWKVLSVSKNIDSWQNKIKAEKKL